MRYCRSVSRPSYEAKFIYALDNSMRQQSLFTVTTNAVTYERTTFDRRPNSRVPLDQPTHTPCEVIQQNRSLASTTWHRFNAEALLYH